MPLIELLKEFCGYLQERHPSLYRRTAIGINTLLRGEYLERVLTIREDQAAQAHIRYCISANDS